MADVTSMQNPWIEMANALGTKSEAELKGFGFTVEEIQMIKVYADPILWADTHLDWQCRDYQVPMLQTMASAKQTVLRLGRRLGKSETMVITILWHAFVQPNKGPNNQYDILIITPYETQIDLIFKRIKQLLDKSPQLKASVKRDIHHQLEFHNGTVIKGLTAGSKSGSGAASTRGQRADLIILDESDYLAEEDITNVLNIRNEAPERIKIISASTPSGRRASYYKWCVNATERTSITVDAKGDLQFNTNKNPEGNGWREVYAPSPVNVEILKTNPDTGKTYLEELREELTELRYIQEVMAEFGESETGVYQVKHIDAAVALGKKLDIIYHNAVTPPRRGPRILGVDWDKFGASTNMVGVEMIEEYGVFAPFCREEIPRTEFTYDVAVQKIIELDEKHNFDWIYVDAGHGEMQIEQLKLHGQKHGTGLDKKVVRVNFSSKVNVFDPITKVKDKKDIKPFMVNNNVLLFERNQIALNPSDKETIKQFEDYHVERIGTNGRPIYTSDNEHIHDCIMLAIHGFNMKYNDTFKVRHATVIAKLDAFSAHRADDPVKTRTEEEKKQELSLPGQSTPIVAGVRYNGRSSRSSRAWGKSTISRGTF